MNQTQTDKIIEFLTELIEFRKREVSDMLKVGYARPSIPKYQERTAELLSLLSSFKTTTNKKSILTDAIDNSNINQNKVLLNEDKQCDELQSLKEKYSYLAADFDNYKKRSLQKEINCSNNITKAIIKDFLRIYDDLELTVKDIESHKSTIDKTNIGIKLVFENFEKLLQSKGCQKIKCSYGDKFDVNTMEAIAVREIKDDEGYDPDDVVEIYQTGWKMSGPTGDTIIRPVKVVVGK